MFKRGDAVIRKLKGGAIFEGTVLVETDWLDGVPVLFCESAGGTLHYGHPRSFLLREELFKTLPNGLRALNSEVPR